MRNTNIRIIVTSLAPEPVHHRGKSGGGVRLAAILRRLGKRSDVQINCISTPYNKKTFQSANVPAEFTVIKSNLKFKSLFGLCLKSLLIVTKALLVEKPNFSKSQNERVVFYSSSDLFWEVVPAFYFKTRRKDAEWIQVIHHIYPDWRKRPGSRMIGFLGSCMQQFSFWLIRKKADKIIILNNIIKKDLMRLGFSREKILFSFNGVDVDYFEKLDNVRGVYDGIFLGRLNPSKGISDLVEIWKNVCIDLPKAKLAIIGGGEAEKKQLQEKIKNNNLSQNIDVLGYLKDNEAHLILKSGKVFLFPSHEEGWGIAISEAMACELPVVSWNLPVFENIFGSAIIQTKKGDISLFSKNVLHLLKSEDNRKKYGKAGKEFIKNYSWENVAKKEHEIITA
jgi:glycosyltransferase involved in cell wall biosynthesis